MPPVLDEISHVPAGDLYFIASLKMLRSGESYLPSESGRTDTVKISSDIKKKLEKKRERHIDTAWESETRFQPCK